MGSCLLGDFNVDLLDPDYVFVLHCGYFSGKLLDLFLVSNPDDVSDFQPIALLLF
jgi:hypothetical protein